MIRKLKTKPPVATVRCAIYTRKSTEEGLDQDFNSLDAQPAYLGVGQRRLRATRRSVGRTCDHAGAPLGS
jgi:hypothetical protein